MYIGTVYLLAPLALFASVVFCYLYFSKNGMYNDIENRLIKTVLRFITYSVLIFLATMFLIYFGMFLLFGMLGLPVLFMLDIIGIVFLIRRAVLSRRDKRKPPAEKKANYFFDKANAQPGN